MLTKERHIPAVIKAGIEKDYTGSLGSIEVVEEIEIVKESEYVIVVIEVVGVEKEVWVAFGSCLEVELMRQHGIDADQVNYHVISRTPLGYRAENDILTLDCGLS